MKKTLLFILVLVAVAGSAFAQGRFKAGLGVNYISNQNEHPHLYDYFAPSVNLSYTLIKKSKFGVSVENATSVRNNGAKSDVDYKFGFTSSLPLLFSVDLGRVTVSTGSGPAYVKQVAQGYGYYEKTSDYYLNNIIGLGFKGQSFLGDLLQSEYNIRLSYLKGLSERSVDGGMISFIVFLKG